MASLAVAAARCDIQRFTRLASLNCRDRIAPSNRFVSPRSALFHIRPPPHLISSPARFPAAVSVHARLFLIWFSAPLSRDLDTAVASSAHGCREICAPMLRDLRTGSATPLCRFHVITALRSFLLVSPLLPFALLTQRKGFRLIKRHRIWNRNVDNSHCQIC
jgi:hypothetical protein